MLAAATPQLLVYRSRAAAVTLTVPIAVTAPQSGVTWFPDGCAVDKIIIDCLIRPAINRDIVRSGNLD